MTTKDTTAHSSILASAELIEIPASYAEFALAIGLSHDASKGDVLAAMAASKNTLHKLLAVVGAVSIDEAIGKVTGERSTHNELVQAVCGPDAKSPTTQDAIAKLGAERKSNERKHAEAMILDAKAAGKTAGDGALKIFDDYGMGAFQAHLGQLQPHAALTVTAPQQKSSKDPGKPGPRATRATSTDERGEIEVVLTRDDEKMIKNYGLDRAQFIEARRAEIQSQRDDEEYAAE